MIPLGIAANVLGCWVIFLTMRKVWWAPIAGVAIQPLWIIYIILGWPATAPLVIMNICLTAVYAAGIRKWMRERHE